MRDAKEVETLKRDLKIESRKVTVGRKAGGGERDS